MGFINEIIDDLDTSRENYAEIKKNLDLLVDLAEEKAVKFQNDIEDLLTIGRVESSTSLYFPISHVLNSIVQYRYTSSKGTSDIIGNVTDAISSLFQDGTAPNVINGVSNIISDIVNNLTGNAKGTETYYSAYAVGIDGKPEKLSIVRTDFIIWSRKLVSRALREQMDSVFSCVAYKSAVDVSKMQFNDFLSVYMKVLRASGTTDMNQIVKEIEDAKRIFEILGGKLEEAKSSWVGRTVGVIDTEPVLVKAFDVETPTGGKYAKL